MNTTLKVVGGVVLAGLISLTGIQSASAGQNATITFAPVRIGQNVKYEGGFTDRFGGSSSGIQSPVFTFPGGEGCEAPPAGITLVNGFMGLAYSGLTTAAPGTYSNICATATDANYEVVVTDITIVVVAEVSLPESSGYVGSEESFSGTANPLTAGMSTLSFYRDGVDGELVTSVDLSSVGDDTTSGTFSVPDVTPGLYYVVASTFGYKVGAFSFTVLEDAPVVDPATPVAGAAQTGGTPRTASLAATGTDSSAPLLAGGVLALAGLGLTIAARRRRASI